MWELTFHEEDKANHGLPLYIVIRIIAQHRGKRPGAMTGLWGRQVGIDEGLGSGVMSWLEIWIYYVQKCDLRQDCTGCIRWESF